MASELPHELYLRIVELCSKADDYVASDQVQRGLQVYQEAWNLLPESKVAWEAATWILSAIGDAHFLENDFNRAMNVFSVAVTCPNGLSNPFIHLRLGQSAYELGERDRAADELTRAYMGGGADIFADEAAKYLAFLSSLIDAPAGRQKL